MSVINPSTARARAWAKYDRLPLRVSSTIFMDIFARLYDAAESGELKIDPDYFLDMLVGRP